jgi:hypothetical protein
MNPTIENPDALGGATGALKSVQLGGTNRQEITKPESGKQPVNHRQARAAELIAMTPGADPATLKVRTLLMLAHDVCMYRVGTKSKWPDELQLMHREAARCAWHAAFSNWPMGDLEKHLEAAMLIIKATALYLEVEDRQDGI